LPKLAPVDKLGGTSTNGLDTKRVVDVEYFLEVPTEFVAVTAATSRLSNSGSFRRILDRLNVRKAAVVLGEVVVPSPICPEVFSPQHETDPLL
jgi:hypothetical protein